MFQVRSPPPPSSVQPRQGLEAQESRKDASSARASAEFQVPIPSFPEPIITRIKERSNCLFP